MEKKGDLINQLAIISDLLEKTNIISESIKITFDLNSENFLSVLDILQSKHGKIIDRSVDSFTIMIGVVEIIFNKNNA